MTFAFYSTDEQAKKAMSHQSSHYAISIDEDGDISCCGGGGCGSCELTNNICNAILLSLYKPDTTLEFSKLTHPEYFI